MKEDPLRIAEDFHWLFPPEESPAAWWLWLALGCIVFFLGIAALFLLRHRQTLLPFLKTPLPHEKALRALQELSRHLREDHHLEFARQVSQIVRVYIQERFGLRAPHRSTEEFLREASARQELGQHDQELLREFLGECDKVKFARRQLAFSQMQALHQSAHRFVQGTIERPHPATNP